MSAKFENILVVGLGLIGGSFAGALKSRSESTRVFGYDSSAESAEKAAELGLIDCAVNSGGDIMQLLRDSDIDLVFLAVPVDAFEEWFRIIADSAYKGIVTDAGSTKDAAIKLANKTLPHPERYVPGHPMAGSEESGLSGARADLFSGAYWILTPDAKTDINAFRRMHELLTSIGARVISVNPEDHDRAVAIVSHVPHIAAAALVTLAGNNAGEGGELLRLAAGGFKDTTRIASGSPELWAGILTGNAGIVADELNELKNILSQFEALIRANDADGIRKLLGAAAAVRDALPSKWVPQTGRLTSVRIPMDDRKGIIAKITTAAGRAECNIEAIDIDHQTEDRAILELILTDEGDIDGFIKTLKQEGFKPSRRALSA
jgi:prephenate dehydrogenase